MIIISCSDTPMRVRHQWGSTVIKLDETTTRGPWATPKLWLYQEVTCWNIFLFSLSCFNTFEQTWIPFTNGCFSPIASLVETGGVVQFWRRSFLKCRLQQTVVLTPLLPSPFYYSFNQRCFLSSLGDWFSGAGEYVFWLHSNCLLFCF